MRQRESKCENLITAITWGNMKSSPQAFCFKHLKQVHQHFKKFVNGHMKHKVHFRRKKLRKHGFIFKGFKIDSIKLSPLM